MKDALPAQDNELQKIRHSVSHIMAQAVLEMFPQAKIAIGPAIESGFYYDFDLPRGLTADDLQTLETRMKEIIAKGDAFTCEEVDEARARKLFSNQPYKLELIDGLVSGGTDENGEPLKEQPKLSIYRNGPFLDLCRGPHVASTKDVNPHAIKLLNVAGAYWRGDERRPMLQRIYGTAWKTPEDLSKYMTWREEVEKRDHRRLLQELDLVSFHAEAGAGLSYWHPKGGQMRVLIEDHWRKRHYEGGYDIVFTPHIGLSHLWETSGHLDFYKDGMYAPMDIDGQDYYIKPMNCPFHIMIYKARLRSYRELPLRWAELGTVYRYERSGTLHGLLRVRGFTQDDAHIFCTPEQIEGEILRVLDFSIDLFHDFGFSDFKIELSVRDPKNPQKYTGADAMWIQAEGSLVKALKARSLPYERMEGEAVFYGPKIDIKIKDVLGRTWQCTTIQFDFNLPERFNMTYIGQDGKEHQPYMVHRALFGSLERFFGILVEHYAGAFPVWLSPVQAALIPIADRHIEFANRVEKQLRQAGLRVRMDGSSERMQAKIRNAQLEKIPYILVMGDKEAAAGQINLRLRDNSTPGAMSVDAFIETAQEAVRQRRLL